MDSFEAAARGAYICFRPAGGGGDKLIIVKRLWLCYMHHFLKTFITVLSLLLD